MILKKIELENIRSYEKEEVQFSPGSTLLSGDIGSGKTTILLGIEFGLFGLQPGQRGSSLLRNGKNSGRVVLEIVVEEKRIIIERSLKRGKTVSQDFCSIEIDGEKNELSVTELKQKVLEILNYPAEFSKKQNLLYKFTVYTPQEEMKQIILEDPEQRVNTLRHIFGIDKYKKIIENVSLLRLKLREDVRMMQGITSSLDEDKKQVEDKIKNIQEMKSRIFSLQKELDEKIKRRVEKEKEKKEVEDKLEERSNLKIKLGETAGLIMSKEEIYENNKKQIILLEKEINESKMFNFDEEELQKIQIEIEELKKEKEKISEKIMNLNLRISSLNSKIEDADRLMKRMQDLETCPTCQQNVDSVYRANVLNKTHNEISQSKSKAEESELEKKELIEKKVKIVNSLEEKEKKLTDLKILNMKYQNIEEKKEKLEKLLRENSIFERDFLLLKKQIESIKEDLLKFQRYELIFEDKAKELAVLLKEERASEIKIAENKKEIEVSEKNLEELILRTKKIEEIKDKLEHVSEIESWLNKKFVPLVSYIERNVMVTLRQEFSRFFSDWFSALVPESFNVRLSENFTPIIEQHDYEIDYAYLSGGERTAIALAYRLALNQIINSLVSQIKTKDVVILDEPTDGFSEQQLDKMREVLDELDLKQLIIVSHEQKIEGFVEKVIRFRKVNGISEKVVD